MSFHLHNLHFSPTPFTLGLGLVAKCEDGNGRATTPATVALLEHLDLLTPAEIEALAPLRRPAITNVRGLSAGVIEAEVRVLDPIV